MRAVIYARFSSDKQRHESVEDQIAVCEAYAEQQGIEVVGTYTDEAKTGRSDRRPGFQRMIRDSSKREWELVLVYKLDRFSRDRLDSLLYRRDLEENGVKVRSVMESIPEGDDGILVDALLTAMAEHYSKALGTNVRRGMNGNAQRHHWNGVPVYGLRPDPEGHYQIYEPEAVHVRKLFEMALDSEVGQLIGYCRAHGIKTTRGNPADYQWVRKTLGNPKYKGTYVWGDVIEENAIPAIVPTPLWEQVQMAKRIKPKSTNKKHDYPLAGKAYCSCGNRMRGSSAKSGKYLYYECTCGRRIPKDVLESIVSASTMTLIDEETVESITRTIEAYSSEYDRSGRKETLERELKDVEGRISNIIGSIESGFDVADLRMRYEELAERKERLEQEIFEAEHEKPPHDLMLQACEAFLVAGDVKDKADIFIRTILVTEKDVIIQFNTTSDLDITEIRTILDEDGSDRIALAPNMIICPNCYGIIVPWKELPPPKQGE